MNQLSAKTTVPLFIVLGSLTTFVGFIVWLTSVAYTTTATAAKVEKMEKRSEEKQDIILTEVINLREDVAVIKTTLKIRR